MYCCPSCHHLIIETPAQLALTIRITTRPGMQDTVIDELNDGALSMDDAALATCQSCGATCTIAEAHAAYPQRPLDPSLYDYAALIPRLGTPNPDYAPEQPQPGEFPLIRVMLHYGEVGLAWQLKRTVICLANVPLDACMRVYDIAHLRIPRKNLLACLPTVGAVRQRYYPYSAVVTYRSPRGRDPREAARKRWPRFKRALEHAGCAVVAGYPGFAFVNGFSEEGVRTALAPLRWKDIEVRPNRPRLM